jgi:hypothetical protein
VIKRNDSKGGQDFKITRTASPFFIYLSILFIYLFYLFIYFYFYVSLGRALSQGIEWEYGSTVRAEKGKSLRWVRSDVTARELQHWYK